MSEHRCILKIEFSIYGQKFEWDTSINYIPNEGDGCDDRIVDWFDACYAKARANYDTENDRVEKRRAAAKREKTERAELARLKAIYEPELTAIPLTANPLIPEGDAAASTGDFDRTDEPGWGRMNLPDGEHGVRWHDPTPAGDFTVAGIVCKVCGHKVVALKSGDVIKRGDPRLCEHLGGPGWTGGFGMKAEESSPSEIDPYKPQNEISDRFEPR